MRVRGTLYRALNPVWARQPLSGAGAARHGGRFNPVGMAALYLSCDPLTALREANQAGDLQPTTLVSFAAEVALVFDGSDAAALARFGATPALLADPGWRLAMRGGGTAPTQRLARWLAREGWSGLLTPSFARGAGGGRNLVLWRWGDAPPARLALNDAEGRLT